MVRLILKGAFGSGRKEPNASAETTGPGGAVYGIASSVDGWFRKGIAFAGIDRHEEALAAYEYALAIDPAFLWLGIPKALRFTVSVRPARHWRPSSRRWTSDRAMPRPGSIRPLRSTGWGDMTRRSSPTNASSR